MSVLVEIDSIPLEKRKKMLVDLNIKEQPKVGKNSKYVKANPFNTYEIIDDKYVTVPFAYYYQHFERGFPNAEKVFPKIKAKFQLELFDRQKAIREETLELLNESRSMTLALATGWGKSLYTVYLACKIGLKTLVFCHRVILIDQWKNSIEKACGSTTSVQVLSAKTKLDPQADFYIINVSNVGKRDRNDFTDIGLLIGDEIHTLSTSKFSKAFGYIFPKFFIGLSATPERTDGLDRLQEVYLGPGIIYRPLEALFNAYLLPTGFTPEIKTNEQGDMDWNSVLSSQAADRRRNELIVDIIRYFTKRNILVLCKRKDHCRILLAGLKKYGVDADVYFGSTKIVNYDCRVLIATFSKGGVGFDHQKLDMLIIGSDCLDNFLQYLGRVFRREWHCPIIVDLIDKFGPLKKHADARCEIYKQTGGQVKNLVNYFPNFMLWRDHFQTDLKDVHQELENKDK